MKAESSPFESSEMLGTFLASTPLLEESWRRCNFADSAAPMSFVADQCGEVGYVAFSGVQAIDWSKPSCGTLMALGECEWEPLFSPLRCDGDGDGEGTVKVDAGFLRLFLEYYRRWDFQNQIRGLLGKVKMIILTGHSFGATTASLTALWLLSNLQAIASPISVLCLTFGTPLLGNESLSRAILRERWGGSFCNVVSKLDVVPKLFFTPLTSLTPQLYLLLQFWQGAMASPSPEQLVGELRKQNFDEFFSNVKKCVQDAAQSEEGARNNLFWPLGSYLFCSEEGAICLDDATSIVKMMHLMLQTVSPVSSFEDHLKYSYFTRLLSLQFLKGIDIDDLSESSYEAAVFLALQSSGIDPQDDNISKPAKDCLWMARHMGRAPNLNNAYRAIELSKIAPCRAQLEWYKARYDESVDQCGYYDIFKKFEASRRKSIIDMNLFRLGAFWDNVIGMAARNELSHDFHRRFQICGILENFVTMPILKDSWNLCYCANFAKGRGFVLGKHNDVGFLAFSGFQLIGQSKFRFGTMEALDESRWKQLFLPLCRNGNSKGRVKVDSGFLSLFLKFRKRFGNQIKKFQQEMKVIIITGHSLGATTATLTALWLLSQPGVSPISVRCITFGTPLLGNESLSQAILREKWGGSFYNVVSKLDLMPRLFFAPLDSSTSQMHVLARSWLSAIASRNPGKFVGKPQKKNINKFFRNIKDCVETAAQSEGGAKISLYWPLGSYLFCLEDGVLHLDNAKSVVKMMQSMFEARSPASSFKDHLKYGYYIKKLSSQFQNRKSIDGLSESSYKAGFKLALPSSRKDPQVLDGGVHNQVKEILPDIQIPQHSQIPLSIQVGKCETRNQRRAEHVINISSESEESSREEEISMSREEKMLMLALIVTSWGSASTAYFGVKKQKFLDWFSMAYVICLILALVVISRGHSHHKTKRWGSHCTLIIIVMTIVVAIAAAMLGKRR